jgi:hypothetical protein
MNLHDKIKFTKIFTRTGTRKWIEVGQDITEFMKAQKFSYAVVWNDEIDFASEALYKHGVKVTE